MFATVTAILGIICSSLAFAGPESDESPSGVLAPSQPTPNTSDELRVALVQFWVGPDRYETFSGFQATVEELIQIAADRHSADVVVFPEYTGVFALFTEYSHIIESSDTLTEALHVVGRQIAASDDMTARDLLRLIVREEALEDAGRLRSMWSELADQADVWVVAGTTFVVNRAGNLVNRLWVFGPDGSLSYAQDKVYLTWYEQGLLGVAPGDFGSVKTVPIAGMVAGFTVCRDSYFDAWEERFQNADVWIELRANGEPYTASVRQRFLGGLSERVREAEVPIGLSSTLNGSYLGLGWEGPSYAVTPQGDRFAEASTVRGETIVVVEVPLAAGAVRTQ